MKSFTRPLLALSVVGLSLFAQPLRADDVTIKNAEKKITALDPITQFSYTNYDASSRQVQIVYPIGQTTTYTYDANTTVSNPGNTTMYTYNAEDRSTATNPITQFSNYSYDQHGSDAKTGATTYTYDSGSTSVPDSADTDPADPARGTTTYQYVGVSKDSNPLDGWAGFALSSNYTQNRADYDTLGVDNNGIYIEVNQINSNNTGLTSAAEIFAIPKASLLWGGTSGPALPSSAGYYKFISPLQNGTISFSGNMYMPTDNFTPNQTSNTPEISQGMKLAILALSRSKYFELLGRVV